MLKKMFLTTLSMVLLISIFPLKYVQADTLETTQLTNEKRITSKDEVLSYAKKNNLPLEYDGKEIAEIIINTDNEALTQANKLDEDSITIEPRIGDICQKLYPYEGYNTNRIAWSTSGVGPGTISNRGSVRKMRISHVKSIFPADTNGLQTFYKLFLYSFNNL